MAVCRVVGVGGRGIIVIAGLCCREGRLWCWHRRCGWVFISSRRWDVNIRINVRFHVVLGVGTTGTVVSVHDDVCVDVRLYVERQVFQYYA